MACTCTTYHFQTYPALSDDTALDLLDFLCDVGVVVGGLNSEDGSLRFTPDPLDVPLEPSHQLLAGALKLLGAETLFSPTTEGTYYAYLNGTNYTFKLVETELNYD